MLIIERFKAIKSGIICKDSIAERDRHCCEAIGYDIFTQNVGFYLKLMLIVIYRVFHLIQGILRYQTMDAKPDYVYLPWSKLTIIKSEEVS